MKGDFSRFSHQPHRSYAGVLMQQGRVTLDADWNEQFDIEDYRLRTQTIDTIGRACAPVHDPGFEISFTPDGSDLIIGPGRIYVDGMLAENRHGSWVELENVLNQRFVPPDMAVDGVPFAVGQWIQVAWDDPSAGRVSAIGRIVDVDETSFEATFFDGPDPAASNMNLRRLVTYRTQPFYRADADPPFADPFTPEQWEGLRHLVYLDVWRRHVTAIEDPHIREVALGGPDTATRVQIVWAVRILFDGRQPFDASDIDCHDAVTLWDDLTAPKAGRLSARAEAAPDPEDPCAIRPEAGYRGLENRLYRVEIHDPGAMGSATFKWSRDNGSILASIVGFPDADEIQVHSLGKDRVLRFRASDVVEVFSDETEISGLPGTPTAVQGQPDEAERILTLSDDVSIYQSHHGPRIRRWDGGPTPTANAFLELEHGVQVRFGGGPFQTGDYWVIPARVATGDVAGFIDATPRGIDHHFARLSLIIWSNDVGDVDAPLSFATTDCRHTFPPLCELPTAGEGCATATVGDGITSVGDFTSIQEAVDSVPPQGPAHIAILPGEYVLDEAVQVTRARLTIAGCDDQTVVRAIRGPAFELEGCMEVRIERLRIMANDRRAAVVVASSTEFYLERCTVINAQLAPQVGDLAGPRFQTTLTTNADPAGPALEVHGSILVWVLDNRLLGSPAVSIQARNATVGGNTIRWGGVWIRDGSRRVTVTGNEILGGLGAGVALGGSARRGRLFSRLTGVEHVEVSHNRIAGMSQSGISTVAGVPPSVDDLVVRVHFDRFTSFDLGRAVSGIRAESTTAPVTFVRPAFTLDDVTIRPRPAVGDIEDVVVVSNWISRCAGDEPDPFYNDAAVGGIVLDEVIGVRISDNEILDNGIGMRAVGILLLGCESIDVSGNRVRGNGSDAGRHADLMTGQTTNGPNPLVIRDIEFLLNDADDSLRVPIFGLLIQTGLRVRVPEPVRTVCFTYFAAGSAIARAEDENGKEVVVRTLQAGIHTISLEADADFVAIDFRPVTEEERPEMSLMQFCAGTACGWYQGGVIGLGLSGEGAGATVALHGNQVESPAGQALLLTGVGPMQVSDNRLLSEGSTVQPCRLADELGSNFQSILLPKTAFIYNAGQSVLLGNQTLAGGGRFNGRIAAGPAATGSMGGGVMYERSSPATDSVLVDSFAAAQDRDPDGPVIFHGNQTGYRPAEGGFVSGSVTIASSDDVAVNDNQIAAESPDGMVFVDAFIRGTTVRVADNSFTEPPRNALLSGWVSGLMAHVTGNQATHCISVNATLEKAEDNQIMMEQVMEGYCKKLAQISNLESAFIAAAGGA